MKRYLSQILEAKEIRSDKKINSEPNKKQSKIRKGRVEKLHTFKINFRKNFSFISSPKH